MQVYRAPCLLPAAEQAGQGVMHFCFLISPYCGVMEPGELMNAIHGNTIK